MGFDKNTVHTNGNSCFGNCFDQIGSSSCNAACLIGLLQRVRDVQNSSSVLLHRRNPSEINNHILVAKHCSAVGDHHIFIIAVQNFLNSVFHTFRTHKLSLFKVDCFSCFCSCNH